MKKFLRRFIGTAMAAMIITGNTSLSFTADYASATYDFNATSSYMYDTLGSQAEKDFYDRLVSACNTVDDSASDYKIVPYADIGSLDYETAKEVAWIFYFDHPEFFWMQSGFSYSSASGLSFKIYEDYQDGTARATAKEEITEIEQGYISGALQYDNQYDRALYLHDALIKDIDYQQGDLDQSAASAFLEKKTVCAGYSRAYSLLCNAVGIESVMFVSVVHGWNVIKIGTQWFHVDVTNDDGSGDAFFLLSDDELYDIDRDWGLEYTVTVNGESSNVFMHDFDTEQFPKYNASFPVCDMSYEKYLLLEEQKTYSAGDVNGDGEVNPTDATLVLQHFSMASMDGIGILNEKQRVAANLNSDGDINPVDATLILSYYSYSSMGGTDSVEDYVNKN